MRKFTKQLIPQHLWAFYKKNYSNFFFFSLNPFFRPEYSKAAATLKGEKVRLGKVDATEETSLGEKYDVKGYPTLKFFRNGSPSEYNGGRTAGEIVSWLRKKTGPPAKALNTAAELSDFKASADAVVVGFFAGAEGDAHSVFIKEAQGNDDLAYGIVTDAALAAAEGAKVPSVVVFKNFDEKVNHFSGPFTADELSAFVNAASTPLVMEFNDDNVKKIFGSKISNKALFFADYEAPTWAGLREQYAAIAASYKGKAVFATVGLDKTQVLEYFGLTAKDVPTFFMLAMTEGSDMKKFKHAEGINGLSGFLDSYLAGNVKPYLKSQPIPTENPTAVRTVVGLNFKEVVLDQSKDVLVEFYAPWCGHCKTLAPKYEKLAKKFAGVSTVVIAAVDSTANDIEDVDVSGFPTLKFWPAGDKAKAIDYDGPRTVKGLTKFLKEHATHKFDLGDSKDSKDAEGGKEDL